MIDNNIKSNISQGEELEELIAQLTQNGMQIKIDKNGPKGDCPWQADAAA